MTTPADFMREYEQSSNTHDFDRVAPLISDDAVFWFNDGSFRGQDQIRRAFEKTWDSIQDEHYALDDINWIAVSEVVAVCIYRFQWKGYSSGQSISGSGRGTSILRKTGGRWQVAHEHLSRMPA